MMLNFSHLRAAALGALVLLVASSCAKKGAPPAMPPAAVQTTPAVGIDAPVVIDAFGTTADQASVDVVPQVSGTLVEALIADGAIVTNGQALFRIDPRDYTMRVRQAEAALAADRATLALARTTVDRNRSMLQQKLVSQEDFDTMSARADSAAAAVQADEATLDLARLSLERCTVVAPLSGICSRRDVDAGNLVAAGMTRLVNIRSYDPINVDFSVSEQDLPLIREAMRMPPVRIEVRPRGDTNSYAGVLAFMDNAVSSQTGTIALRASVPNADLKLWANQFVAVRVFARVEQGAVMVPEGAVQFGKMGTYLFAVSATNTAEMRLVKTGVRYNDLLQICSGVAVGERIVVLGQLRLFPGAPVMDLAQKAPAAPPAAHPAPADKNSPERSTP